ncbi:hypothetical protein [Nannocystis pusilla]|uniref:hypothetical protein n=1 Tax=Nannocystis pusilla TaxID=889268 RepID=UPI003DA4F9C7
MYTPTTITQVMRPEPDPTPARNACHQLPVNDMHNDTRLSREGPDPNSPVLRTIALLAIIAGCVWGGMPEALVALLLRYLP